MFILLAVAVFAATTAFTPVQAQGNQPPVPGNGTGVLHDYMLKEIAKIFGISEADLLAKMNEGLRMYNIAVDKGLTYEQFAAKMQEARKLALANAVKDGVITQEQADWMSQRGPGMMGQAGGMGGRGRMGGQNGFAGRGTGLCPWGNTAP
jgi:hypothetical protein